MNKLFALRTALEVMVKNESAVPGFWFATVMFEIVPAPEASELRVSDLPALTPATSATPVVVPGMMPPVQSLAVSQVAEEACPKMVAPWREADARREVIKRKFVELYFIR